MSTTIKKSKFTVNGEESLKKEAKEIHKIALWEKTTTTGNPFYSAKATIEGKDYNFIIFKNNNKSHSGQPDYTGESRS